MEEDSILDNGGVCDGCSPSVFGLEHCFQCPCYKCQENCDLPFGKMCEKNQKYLLKKVYSR